MTTKIRLPPQFATNDNYSSGPDVGTPTKVDPATPGNGFVAGTAIAPQHVNFHLGGLASAGRRPITLAALKLRPMDTTIAGSAALSDTTSALGVLYGGLEKWLTLKAGADGANSFTDSDLVIPETRLPAALTDTILRAVAGTSRNVVIGNGGNQNAFSTDAGVSWTMGGALGLSNMTDLVWDGTQFIVCNSSGASVHSVDATAWTAAVTDIASIVVGTNSSLAALSAGTVIAAGTVTGHPHFCKTVDHGAHWTDAGSVPTPADYLNAGCLAGRGDGEVYWLSPESPGLTLDLFASSDGSNWVKRSEIGNLQIAGSAVPRLLMCPQTGLLVAAIVEVIGGFSLSASFDRGHTWTEPLRCNINNSSALALAGGRLWATRSGMLFAADGIGFE